MLLRPIIIGLKKSYLLDDEIYFLKSYKPLGVILFKRNIINKKQIKIFISEIKKILGNKAIIMIDQEGGKVNRLSHSDWSEFPPANLFGNIALQNIKLAKHKTYSNYAKIGKELAYIGISHNCAPVLDLKVKGSNEVIGSRAFSRDPIIVTTLAKQACKALIKQNIFPVIKHIPGHGRAKEDSHLSLPEINLSGKQLEEDFFPFRQLNSMPFAMTAHIKYNKIDSKYCATFSKKIISSIIRNKIGFKGILFSDDLCMKALKGEYFERARKAIEAGCDIVLHCNGDLNKTAKSAEGSGFVSDDLKKNIYK